MEKSQVLVSVALAALAATAGCAGAKKDSAAAVVKGECLGVNACKGQGECGGTGHSCAGKNACKGKGWLALAKADCDAKGGQFTAR
jgi:hypothetical protein